LRFGFILATSLLIRGGLVLDFIPLHLMPLVLAMISGILMAIQGSLNASLSKTIGLWEATFVVYATGTIVLLVALLVFKFGKGDLTDLGEASWYSYFGGLVGVYIIYLVAASIPEVGVSNATTAIIVGQVLTAVVIDHLGGFGLQRIAFGWNQVIGLILLSIGAKLLLK